MKKRIFKMCLVLIGILIIGILCINSSYYIEKQTWKYSDGVHIGDWLGESNFKIQDGIIYGNSGKAKIVFCFGFKLVIKNIVTGEKGFYVNKN